ncbi:11028_t:CDS:1, partial [Scutellospora calospora]
ANQLISITHTAPKQFFALSLNASKLYSALKHINKCYHILTFSLSSLSTKFFSTTLNKHLTKATSLAELLDLTLNQQSL